ncbi:MAG: hypothetical protein KAZ18_01080 [Acinetobacter sp.]|nr:hypothetical protein [Acinetobacter sp.]
MGLTNTQKVVLVIVLFIILLIGWGLFPLFFKWLMIGIGSQQTELEDFGAMGDIYGSLNTLFTSATLAFVVYATLLQRQANQDARYTMTKQLQQAKNAARHQLKLVRLTHEAQMKELKKSNFDNKFYALINYKMELFNSIRAINSDKDEISGSHVFDKILLFFAREILINESQHFDLKELKSKYFSFLSQLNNNTPLTSMYSYFLVYESIFMLIDLSELDDTDKALYRHLVRNSMFASEQLTLFFIAPFYEEFMGIFVDREMFQSFDMQMYKKYALSFYDKTFFFNDRDKIIFDESENPT